MKSLPVLIKLSKQRVDQQRIRVAKAQEPVTALKNEIYQLETSLESEARIASGDPVLSNAYGAYASAVQEKMNTIEEKLKKAQLRLRQEQERLSQLFKDQKVLEVYQDRKLEELQSHLNKQEQAQLDELAARLAHQPGDS